MDLIAHLGAVAITSMCAGCGACLLTCPTHAIRPYVPAPGHASEDPYRQAPGFSDAVAARLLVRGDLCTGCGECIEVCPVDAIEELFQ